MIANDSRTLEHCKSHYTAVHGRCLLLQRILTWNNTEERALSSPQTLWALVFEEGETRDGVRRKKSEEGVAERDKGIKKKYREEGPCFYAFHLQILTTCQTPSLNCTRIPTSQRWSTQVLKSQRPQTVFTTRKSSTTRKTGQQYTYCLLLHKYLSIANCCFLISRLNWKTL